jgi:hypothetical protein
VSSVGAGSAQDELRLRVLDRGLVGPEIIPVSATTVTSGNWWPALKALYDREHGLGLGLLPSIISIINVNPAASASRPRVMRLQAAFLGEPRITVPITLTSLEVRRGHVVDHQ